MSTLQLITSKSTHPFQMGVQQQLKFSSGFGFCCAKSVAIYISNPRKNNLIFFCDKNLVEYKRVFKSWSDEMNWVNGAHSESRLGKL